MYRRLTALLREAGCYVERQGRGSHEFWYSPITRRHLPGADQPQQPAIGQRHPEAGGIAESILMQPSRLILTALFRDAAPERRDQALKSAIKVLIDSPRLRLSNRSPAITPGDRERWASLKPRLRAHLTKTKIAMALVAEVTGLPVTTRCNGH